MVTALIISSSAQSIVQRWEYAVYGQTESITLGKTLSFNFFSSAQGGSGAEDISDFASKLVGRKVTGKESALIVIFNYLGSQGWELVNTKYEDKGDFKSTAFYFKRPVE